METSECAISTCKRSIVRGLLMCPNCWYMVTPRTRSWVNHAWREASSRVADPIRKLELIKGYRAAREQAIAEVNARLQEVQLAGTGRG